MCETSINHKRRLPGRPREFDRERALISALEIFWREGYEPASVANLCQEMRINPPSLYATFGNKAQLFLEAVRFYEKKYWQEPAVQFMAEPDLRLAVAKFFDKAAQILLAPDTPCGCMVVLAAVNICQKETEIIKAIREMRLATEDMFAQKLKYAIASGQIPPETDVASLAAALNALLEGLSLQARANMDVCRLKAIAAYAIRLLPDLPSGN